MRSIFARYLRNIDQIFPLIQKQKFGSDRSGHYLNGNALVFDGHSMEFRDVVLYCLLELSTFLDHHLPTPGMLTVLTETQPFNEL